MPKRIKLIVVLLFALALLGCALTARLQDGGGVPTRTAAEVLASPTGTPTPTSVSLAPSPSATVVPSQTPAPQATPTQVSASSSPTPSPPPAGGTLHALVEAPPPLPQGVTLMRVPVQQHDRASAAALASEDVPMRDLRSLAIRLRGVRPDVPAVISEVSPDYELGTVRTFKAHDDDNQETFIVEAELRYKTEHLYMWVERGVDIEQARLEVAAEIFESQIYPINRAFFGSEWTPGVDGDPHLSVLHVRRLGSGIAGYYSSADQYPAEVRPDSNQMEMFYINADNANVGSAFYMGTLAHEFQHMIHWYNDRNEETWLNEGMSELASLLNGFDPGGSDYSWAVRPDTQLNTWSDDDARSAHYGGSFLFATYLLDRFGEALTQAVVVHPGNGIASIDAVLAENGTDLTFTDVFADWLVAAYLDDPELADGQFGYDLIGTIQPELDAEHIRYPAQRESEVSQYGVDYVYLRGGTDLTLDFYGATRARLLDTQPHSGDFFWYANRGDDSDTRLTRAFDLSGLNQATLRFWTWYDIEADWDYGYVQVSDDGGATWHILRGPSTTDTNPNDNSYGWGYTGRSGDVREPQALSSAEPTSASSAEPSKDAPIWIEEQVDLSDFAGQEILVRFEYITDDALNYPGWVLDDIAIPELNYRDDVEGGDGGWQAEGFVRTNNFVPQGYLLQLITVNAEATVQRLPLRDDQSARWRLALADADHAVLLVSGLAPLTTETATYFYRLEEE
jgi:immune inhibitor A